MPAIQIKGGETYRPQTAKVSEALPVEFANRPFVFLHYAMGWTFDDDAGFLPDLSEIQAMPGVNGVGDDGRLSRAIGSSIQKGGTVIDPQSRRLGPWQDFIERLPCFGGGWHYAFRGAEFTVLPGGKVFAEDTSAEFKLFRTYLRDNSIVEPMARPVFNKLLGMEQKALDRAIRDADTNPHRASKVDARKARLLAMNAAWLKMNTPADEGSGTVEDADAAPVGRVRITRQKAPAVEGSP